MLNYEKNQDETTNNNVFASANSAETSDCIKEKNVSQNEDDLFSEEWFDPVIDTDTYNEDEDDSYSDTYEDFYTSYNTIKVGPYEMRSHFSEDALRPDNDDIDTLNRDTKSTRPKRSNAIKRSISSW